MNDSDKPGIKEALEDYASILRWMYFDYMMTVDDSGSFEDFKRVQLEVTETLLDRIHDKYCDHVEAQRSQMP